MSTITPTSDQQQIIDVTSFQVGDLVQSKVDGRIGTIVTPDGLVPNQFGVFLPQALPPLPLATPAAPTTTNVNVNWTDGTSSRVPLSTLRRA